MKEKIYTIPVTDAFSADCECPLCVLEKKLEDEGIEYALGASLMEPDYRQTTNELGFCRTHFEAMYNKQVNRLGLALMIDTFLQEKNSHIKKIFESKLSAVEQDATAGIVKNISKKLSPKQTNTERLISELVAELDGINGSCAICSKLEHTMDRYIDVIFYLYFKEPEFKQIFHSKKGFCLKHLRLLLSSTSKYLNTSQAAIFIKSIMEMQISNLDRIEKEVDWFTKKFDYRYNNAPWENSKDAVTRSIQKIRGNCEFK
ncbi:hypothetical protein LY28_03550 [Ruminiclostridium sufflavum DSM 19573]|uniref:ABC transporter substrate-binding protein n=1 Tax=Ruminiclostridium sufflavum DSM 19573 TaxID=1121337 RepID=A0A318XJ06_9FIRM|nr:DUF6062 family protein [Ruminiclostridium sufflavum]PYG84839.1 hypothetical protein LY28_03550 [Ruminiclostridium sufflavum DSM 19573]